VITALQQQQQQQQQQHRTTSTLERHTGHIMRPSGFFFRSHLNSRASVSKEDRGHAIITDPAHDAACITLCSQTAGTLALVEMNGGRVMPM
jgi:hypothetical protein